MDLNENSSMKDFSEDEMKKFDLWVKIFEEWRGREDPNTPIVLKRKPINTPAILPVVSIANTVLRR